MSLKEVDPGENDEWLKIGNVTYMTFVGFDVVAFGRGCYIILYNITTREEVIYKADSEERGEGVQCLVGYQLAHMFAFAEMSPFPRVFLVKYPTNEQICVLKDNNVAHSYIAMSFAEMECLVCLTGIPVFEIIVWCWRTGEKLASQPTGIVCPYQSLRCSVSMPIGVSVLAKHERETVFQLWQINICSKLCLLSKTEIVNGGLDKGTFVSSFCWSPEGTLMVADTMGSLYLVKDDAQRYVKVMSWPYKLREGSSMLPTNTLWWKDGVVMSGPNGFIQFIKRLSNTDFQPGWCITNEGPLLVMAVNRSRDHIVGWSHKHTLVHLKMADQSATLEEMKHYGAVVRLFTFVHPVDMYIASVSTEDTLDLWDKRTGLQVGSMVIGKGFVLDMQCNPQMPYLALGCSDGVLAIVAVHDTEPFLLSELVLCHEEITGVVFNSTGTLIVVASYKIGRIFVTQGLVGTGQKVNVLHHLLSDQPICNMQIMSPARDLHKLLVLVVDSESAPASSQLLVYSLPKLEVECNVSLDTLYGDIIYANRTLLAAPYLSRQIHVIDPSWDENIVGLEVTQKVASGHQVRRFHISVSHNHILTYGWDGLIFVRREDDLTPFCVRMAHHRFTNGVKYAAVDRQAEYILSLGKDLNFICSKVSVSCGHSSEEHKVDSTRESYFSIRKQTLGKAALGSTTSRTWLETQRQQKLNLEAANAGPDIEAILKDFKVVKKELVHLLDENFKVPQEERLDVLEFDLDTETREELLAEAEVERDKYRRLLEAECRDCDRLAEVIRQNTWDTMDVKSRCIKAMLKDFSVDNYGLPPEPPGFMEELVWETEARKLTMEMSKNDYFEPWFPFPGEDKSAVAVEPTQSGSLQRADTDKEEESSTNKYLFFGSSSYQFVDISPIHCSQFEICSSFSNSSEVVLLEKICMDLREYFNKLFDEMFVQKEREMGVLAERNSRLRTILSELRITCNGQSMSVLSSQQQAPMDVDEPIDAEWTQEEKTERIVTIEDSEVE